MITKKSTYTYSVHRYDPLVQDIEEEHVWRLFGRRIFSHSVTVIVDQFPGETQPIAGFKIKQKAIPATPEKNTQL